MISGRSPPSPGGALGSAAVDGAGTLWVAVPSLGVLVPVRAAGRQVTAGERVAALAVPWSTAPDVEPPGVRLEGGRLTGTITSVAGAIEADVLLVAAGSGLYAVDVSAVTVTPRVCLDMTRQLADDLKQLRRPLIREVDRGGPRADGVGPRGLGGSQTGLSLLCFGSHFRRALLFGDR